VTSVPRLDGCRNGCGDEAAGEKRARDVSPRAVGTRDYSRLTRTRIASMDSVEREGQSGQQCHAWRDAVPIPTQCDSSLDGGTFPTSHQLRSSQELLSSVGCVTIVSLVNAGQLTRRRQIGVDSVRRDRPDSPRPARYQTRRPHPPRSIASG